MQLSQSQYKYTEMSDTCKALMFTCKQLREGDPELLKNVQAEIKKLEESMIDLLKEMTAEEKDQLLKLFEDKEVLLKIRISRANTRKAKRERYLKKKKSKKKR